MSIEDIRIDFMKPLYKNQHFTKVPLVPSYDLDDLFDLCLNWNDAVEYFIAYDYPTELYLEVVYDGDRYKTIRLTTSQKIQLVNHMLKQCKKFGGDENADSSKTKERRHNTVEGNAKKTSGGAKKVQKRRKSRGVHS